MEGGNAKNSALMAKKAPTMPKPQWHPPWKLYRVSESVCYCTAGSMITAFQLNKSQGLEERGDSEYMKLLKELGFW